MATPIYDSTFPKYGADAYSRLPEGPDTTSKTKKVYHEQQAAGQQETKGEAQFFSLTAQAESYSQKGTNNYSQKKYHSSYLNHLSAKKLLEQLPQTSDTIQKLIDANLNLALAAKEIRFYRRTAATEVLNSFISCFIGGFLCIPCACYQFQTSSWVDNGTFRAYIDSGLKLLEDHFFQLQKKHHIEMNTDKNSIPIEVRKNLAYAYYMKARFHGISDFFEAYNSRNSFCFSDCCFEGTNGTTDVSRYQDNATRLSYLKLAKEWDPSDTTYEAAYQRLDSSMKTPVVYQTIYYD